jgi:hypothetical protein
MTLQNIRFPRILWIACLLGIQANSLALPELDPKGALYGPTIVVEGAAVSPVVQGAWVPNGTFRLGFTWLEPLKDIRLGSELGPNSQFMRFSTDGYLSPWYGMLQSMVGFRMIPHVEFSFVYQVNAYFMSNVQMDTSQLSSQWRADHVFDHAWSDDRLEYSQAFGLWLSSDFSIGESRVGGEFRHFLIDVNTDKTQKSFDFVRGIPVYSRDFFYEMIAWCSMPVSEHLYVDAVYEYQQTGLFTKWIGNYQKQPVRQSVLFLGPHWQNYQSGYSLRVEPGFFFRQEQFDTSNLSERFLFRVLWQKRFAWERR